MMPPASTPCLCCASLALFTPFICPPSESMKESSGRQFEPMDHLCQACREDGVASDLTRAVRFVKRAAGQSALDRPCRHLGPGADAKLAPDAFHVPLGGTLRDEQPFRDLPVGETRRDHGGDLALAPAERAGI